MHCQGGAAVFPYQTDDSGIQRGSRSPCKVRRFISWGSVTPRALCVGCFQRAAQQRWHRREQRPLEQQRVCFGCPIATHVKAPRRDSGRPRRSHHEPGLCAVRNCLRCQVCGQEMHRPKASMKPLQSQPPNGSTQPTLTMILSPKQRSQA
jgi:hypothetical protein